MKKIFMVIFLVFLMVGTASAKEFTISICDSPTSGTTTAASGTSPLWVNHVSGTSNIYIGDSKSGECIVQLKDILSGLTVSEDQRVSGGDNSGVSVTLRYKEYVVNTANHRAGAQTVDIWSGMLFSGNTPYQIKIYPEAMGFIEFEIVSGITPLGRGDFIFRTLD